MKKLPLYAMAAGLLLSSLATTSCKKDDDTPEETTPTVTAKKPMYAMLGGTAFTATGVTAASNGGSITIIGVNGTKYFTIIVPSTATAGTTYNVGSTASMGYTPNGGSTNYMSTSGSIVVTKHDTSAEKIEGTYSGVLTNTGGSGTISVASGEFNAGY